MPAPKTTDRIQMLGFKLNLEYFLIRDNPYAPKIAREKFIKKFARFIVIDEPPQRPNLYKKTLNGLDIEITNARINKQSENFISVLLKKFLRPKNEKINVVTPAYIVVSILSPLPQKLLVAGLPKKSGAIKLIRFSGAKKELSPFKTSTTLWEIRISSTTGNKKIALSDNPNIIKNKIFKSDNNLLDLNRYHIVIPIKVNGIIGR